MLEQKGKHSYIPQRASLSPAARTPTTNRPIADDLLEEDERYYPVRPSSSAIRYTTTQGEEVIQQGNKRIIIHHEPPPTRQRPPQQQVQTEPGATSRKHWLFWVGCIFCIMLLGWTVFTALSGFLQQKRNDLLYGNPRTFQIDAVVGHYGRMSHFTSLNLNGYLEIFETQEGHPEVAHIFTPTTLRVNPLDPVILSFQDVNGDGKPDMIITAPSFQAVLFNNGTSFQSQPPAPSH